jgi:YD repeat-containing protein
MKAYKASYNGKCQSFNYEVGKTYTYNGKLVICSKGFHFCNDLDSLLEYYPMKKELKIFEIEVLGKVISIGNNSVTDKLKVIREIPLSEFKKGLKNYEFDKKNNLIYFKNSNGIEEWNEYDKNDNLIHCKYSNGKEYWKEYDKNDNLIHYKDSNGIESWNEYDNKNNLIHYKDSKGYEYWNEYDKNDNIIHHKDSDGFEEWYKYDKKNDLIHCKDSRGFEWSM